jgi:hypothetical protein
MNKKGRKATSPKRIAKGSIFFVPTGNEGPGIDITDTPLGQRLLKGSCEAIRAGR